MMVMKAIEKEVKHVGTVKDVSTFLVVSKSTVYEWVELGKIPHSKVNGCIRFDMDDVKQWFISCKKEPISDYNHLTQVGGSERG